MDHAVGFGVHREGEIPGQPRLEPGRFFLGDDAELRFAVFESPIEPGADLLFLFLVEGDVDFVGLAVGQTQFGRQGSETVLGASAELSPFRARRVHMVAVYVGEGSLGHAHAGLIFLVDKGEPEFVAA